VLLHPEVEFLELPHYIVIVVFKLDFNGFPVRLNLNYFTEDLVENVYFLVFVVNCVFQV